MKVETCSCGGKTLRMAGGDLVLEEDDYKCSFFFGSVARGHSIQEPKWGGDERALLYNIKYSFCIILCCFFGSFCETQREGGGSTFISFNLMPINAYIAHVLSQNLPMYTPFKSTLSTKNKKKTKKTARRRSLLHSQSMLPQKCPLNILRRQNRR